MIPIRQFRDDHKLPASFGVNYFEPKDHTGLADIRHAAPQMNALRQTVLDAVPDELTLESVQMLAAAFRKALQTHNDHIGLKDVEIDYAVAGFGDVLEAFVYANIRAGAEKTPPPSFEAVYQHWLAESQRIAAREFTYGAWIVQIINNAYGRMGLFIRFEDGTSAEVTDNTLACPAESFTFRLLQEVIEHLEE
mgnify:CR=1 FL=1